jgi:hypothetical protein
MWKSSGLLEARAAEKGSKGERSIKRSDFRERR